MAIDAKKLSADVGCAIAANLDIEDDESLDILQEKLKHMSVREAFEAYLTWHGIIGYTEILIETLDNIRAAEIKDKTHLTLNKGHIIDCWHEGSKSYYRATVIQPLTPEEVQTP